jgi:hypothetical protein
MSNFIQRWAGDGRSAPKMIFGLKNIIKNTLATPGGGQVLSKKVNIFGEPTLRDGAAKEHLFYYSTYFRFWGEIARI